MDIGMWLRELGLERYEQAFRKNDIGPDVLPTLSAGDLTDIGVTVVGHRRKLLNAIAALRDATAPGEASPAVSAPKPAPERRQLTVMFVDMVGSTSLAARLDPEAMRDVLTAYQNVVAGAIARTDGHVAKFMGDGVLAYFGWPVAHEDEAERAIRAGRVVTEAVAGLQTPSGEALSARVGIATGLVVVGDLVGEGSGQEQAVVGGTPNLAARLQEIAAPGQVVIAEATQRLVAGVFTLRHLGGRALKGLGEPVDAYVVTGERATESRFEARSGTGLLPMVGREAEMAVLRERWVEARAGLGQGVLLVGEAGIGKSRIVRALLDSLEPEPHTRLRYQCSPYHSESALWPVIQHLGHAAGITAGDPSAVRLDKLEALLAQAVDDIRTAAPLVASLLGADGDARYGALDLAPQVQLVRTLRSLVDQLLGLARRQPVLLVLEDAQWIDPTTHELIVQCLDRIADAPVLVLLTSRPESLPELAGHPRISRHTLHHLRRAEVEAIVGRLAGRRELPRETVEAIVARADGVPLFVEELTRAVVETGEMAIPASLHDSLMARLDRRPEAKAVAQVAACIGRAFPKNLLAEVADTPPGRLEDALDRLVESEVVLRRRAARVGAYVFRHALVQDAAYQSLLLSRRRDIHARLAAALEARVAGAVEANPIDLARHYLLADAPNKALRPLKQAAERAAAVGATAEAIAHYRKALELLARTHNGDERATLEAELLLGLGIQTQIRHGAGADEPGQLFARAISLARGPENARTRFAAAWNLWRVHNTRADFEEARAAAEDLPRMARETGEAELILQAHHSNWKALETVGELRGALAHVLRGRRHAKSRSGSHAGRFAGHDAVVCGAGTAAKLQLLMGQWAEADREMRDCMRRAERLGDRGSLGIALQAGIGYGLLRRDPAFVQPLATRMLKLGEPEALQDFMAFGQFARGWVAAAEGDLAAGEADMRAAIALADAAGRMLDVPIWLALLAETLAGAGRIAEAGEFAAEALALVQGRSGTAIREPEVMRICGAIAAMAGHREEATHHLEQAIAAARASGARLTELRAATTLARLCADEGDRKGAHELLTPVYEGFTEGFDTPELMDAKALLDTLA